MNNKFERLTFNEVIFQAATSPNIRGLTQTFKVQQLVEVVKAQFAEPGNKLFEEGGLDLEVLKLDAQGWKKGKVRFSVEFCPDEPDIAETLTSNHPENSKLESPLDDIRQMMSKDSQ